MITAGVDIGSTTTKAVILDDGKVRSRTVLPSGNLPGETAKRALADVLKAAQLAESDLAMVAATGYGRRLVDLGGIVMTEIKACAAGALAATAGAAVERVHTVIDVGGQDTKVIALDDAGDIEDFSMNDKCAAGTGRFLEMLAHKLDLSYGAFVDEAMKSDTMIQMNATCAVFAESEVVGLLARNISKADIAAAAHNAIASRIASMTRRVGSRGSYCFVGGGARNAALVKAVQEALNKPVHTPADPQTVIALGAAVGARRKVERAGEKDKDENAL
ncbi:MAG TPA: acyl-CoA dehydratase activase [Planctomycetota bacterium]|nr:acyl-CoA dehydratase activase [Planctomycetota bacterium]